MAASRFERGFYLVLGIASVVVYLEKEHRSALCVVMGDVLYLKSLPSYFITLFKFCVWMKCSPVLLYIFSNSFTCDVISCFVLVSSLIELFRNSVIRKDRKQRLNYQLVATSFDLLTTVNVSLFYTLSIKHTQNYCRELLLALTKNTLWVE